MPLSTFAIVALLVIVLIFYGVFHLFRWCFRSARKALRNRHQTRKAHREEQKAEKKRLRAEARASEERQKAEARASEERRKAEEETRRRIALIDHVSIVGRRKIFDSSRKYHYETTFMVFQKNGDRSAVTAKEGSRAFDILVSLLEGDVSFADDSSSNRETRRETATSERKKPDAPTSFRPIVSLECVHCGGVLDINPDDLTRARCPHCNRQYLVPANETVQLQKIVSDAHKAIELNRQTTDETVARMDAAGRECERKRDFRKWVVDVLLARSGLCVGAVFSVVALIFDRLRPLLFFGLIFLFVDLIVYGIRSMFHK